MAKMEKKKNAALDLQNREATNQRLIWSARHEIQDVYQEYQTGTNGLNPEQVEENQEKYGENTVVKHKEKSFWKRIFESFVNPFSLILIFLALVSTVTDIILPLSHQEPADPVTVTIILALVIIAGMLRFIEETRSGKAADSLLDMITTTAAVVRQETGMKEIPLDEVTVGDIVKLSAGDMIPADVRIIEAKDLFISQSALTGESEQLERYSTPPLPNENFDAMTDYPNLAFMGSNVVSGAATAVVIAVGNETLFGGVAQSLAVDPAETTFEKGVNSVSWILIRFMLVMVPVVFFINGFTKGDWMKALLFAISVGVGLTPEMLPMIVTTCLAKGSVSMSKEKTIVKNLNSIQNLGAIDILCTDKTGTLTQDKVVLEYHMDVNGAEDSRVLKHAFLNSYFQTGLRNLMDIAIIEATDEESEKDPWLKTLSTEYTKVDEVPFDFARRRMSVVVEDSSGKVQMITKGAVEEMLSISTYVMMENEIVQLSDEVKRKILKTVDDLNEDGMRVIAVAQKTNPSPVGSFGVKDECDMLLMGYLAFLDPPKESTAAAILALKQYGVSTKILTGDNDKVTRCICKQVGLKVDNIRLGSEIQAMSDKELSLVVEETTVFAKLSPDQKARIIRILRENGHVVGYMGDGINDASAMKESDVGISVDTAVDIAKESADIILLEKDLMVLEKGIIEGRKTYANMIKYIKMTASSNFGNMFSVVAASALLPFLPMESVHLILLNLLYDTCCTTIPWDNVDEEYLKIPRTWDASSVGSFMIWIGPTSSIFDWATYLLMYFVICPQFVSGGLTYHQIDPNTTISSGLLQGMDMRTAYVAMFQAGWFVESMWTQTLVIHMIRTPKIPFIQSNASAMVTLVTAAGIAIATAIPFTPLGTLLGFVHLPWIYFVWLAVIVVLYMLLTTIMKKVYIRRYGEWL